MSCCSTSGTNKTFSKTAGRYARRYRRRGLDASQRALLEGLTSQSIKDATILDIGCGVGSLHIELLKAGAARSYGVDVAEGMIVKAKELSKEAGVSGRTEYSAGDFLALNGDVPQADIVVMDKLLCCTPDVRRMIEASAGKARNLLAVSFPNSGLLARASFLLSYSLGRLLRWSFYPFYHDPAMVLATITASGFDSVYASRTIIWQVIVFRRRE